MKCKLFFINFVTIKVAPLLGYCITLHLQCFFSQAMDSGVGLISISKSGDLALSIATHLPNVKATVWINGCCSNVAIPLYYKGSQIHSALMYDSKYATVTESGALNIKHCMHDPLAPENEGSLIPIELATGRFLFVAAEDDLNCPS